jgi:hypothetical protein
VSGALTGIDQKETVMHGMYGPLSGDAPPERLLVEVRRIEKRVHCCTRDQLLRTPKLPLEQIVDHEIDPWRVDLLDSQPVSLPVDGEELLFRRLRDVAFAYEISGGKSMVVCFHDGESAVSLVADFVEKGEEWLENGRTNRATPHVLDNVRPSDHDFREHLRRYLELRISAPNHAITATVSARKARAVKFRGSSLIFDLSEPGLATRRPAFTGEMFEMLALPFTLDPRINWLFDELRPWRPVVHGHCLHRALRRRAQDMVNVIVEEGALTHVLRNLGGAYSVIRPEVIFKREGFSYHITCQQPHMTEAELFDFDDQYYQRLYARVFGLQSEQYSCDRLHCVASDQVWGQRIAFHDVLRDQTRQFSGFGKPPESRMAPLMIDDLTIDGLTIVGR